MNLFVDSNSLVKNKKKILNIVENEPYLTMTVYVSSYLSKYYMFNLIRNKFNIRPSIIMNVSLLDSSDIKLYCNDRMNMELIVDRKLTKAQIKKLNMFTRTIKLHDISNCAENIDYYIKSNNIVYSTNSQCNLDEAVAFDLSFFNYSDYTCKNSSCLGKTICIDKNNELYFCPHHHKDSHLCNLSEIDRLEEAFNHDSFLKTIDLSIDRRKHCNSKNCPIYEKCYGGCPLETTNCDSINSRILLATQKRKDIMEKGINLQKLKTYERESIQKEVSGFPLTKN